MKFKQIIQILIIASSFNALAQTEEPKPKNWIVKLNTTALVDIFSFPSIQFAVERKIKPYFSLQTEAGIQAYSFRNAADTLSIKDSGFRLMAEGRFYVFNFLKKDKSKTRKSDGLYTGVQVFYRENNYNERLMYYANHSSNTEIDDDYGIKKKVHGINLCLGYQIPIHNFIIEPYSYIGYLNRDIKNFNRSYNENQGHILYDHNHPFIYKNDKSEDSGSGVNFSFGLRVGYKF